MNIESSKIKKTNDKQVQIQKTSNVKEQESSAKFADELKKTAGNEFLKEEKVEDKELSCPKDAKENLVISENKKEKDIIQNNYEQINGISQLMKIIN